MATSVTHTSELMNAIRAGNLDGVLLAIGHGANLEEADMHGFPGLPMRTACFAGHYDIVLALIEHGADVNAPTAEGNGAPLRLAQRAKHQHIVSLLLERGADRPCEPAPSPKPLTKSTPLPVTEVTKNSAESPPVTESTASPLAPSGIAGDLRRQSRPENNLIEFTSYAIPTSNNEPESKVHGNSIEFSHSAPGSESATSNAADSTDTNHSVPTVSPLPVIMPDMSDPSRANDTFDASAPTHIEEIEMSAPYGVDTDILARDLSRLAAGAYTTSGRKS